MRIINFILENDYAKLILFLMLGLIFYVIVDMYDSLKRK